MPTIEQLRHDIDSGRGGDKVANIDPAAAPLGADDEAAGHPPTKAEVKLAYKHEIRKRTAREDKYDGDHGVAMWVSIVLLWSTALFSAIWFIRP